MLGAAFSLILESLFSADGTNGVMYFHHRYCFLIFNAHNSSCGKVIFSQVSLSHSIHMRVCLVPVSF